MKGQTGLEFMLIMAISLAILIPLYAYLTSYSAQTRQDLKFKALEDNIESLAEAADLVYSQGYPSKMTINFYVPESARNFSIINDHVIVVHLTYTTLNTDIAASTEATINGSLPLRPGNYRVSVTAQKDGWVNISY